MHRSLATEPASTLKAQPVSHIITPSDWAVRPDLSWDLIGQDRCHPELQAAAARGRKRLDGKDKSGRGRSLPLGPHLVACMCADTQTHLQISRSCPRAPVQPHISRFCPLAPVRAHIAHRQTNQPASGKSDMPQRSHQLWLAARCCTISPDRCAWQCRSRGGGQLPGGTRGPPCIISHPSRGRSREMSGTPPTPGSEPSRHSESRFRKGKKDKSLSGEADPGVFPLARNLTDAEWRRESKPVD